MKLYYSRLSLLFVGPGRRGSIAIFSMAISVSHKERVGDSYWHSDIYCSNHPIVERLLYIRPSRFVMMPRKTYIYSILWWGVFFGFRRACSLSLFFMASTFDSLSTIESKFLLLLLHAYSTKKVVVFKRVACLLLVPPNLPFSIRSLRGEKQRTFLFPSLVHDTLIRYSRRSIYWFLDMLNNWIEWVK